MSSSHRLGKEVATSSHKKRSRSGIPLAPTVPRGKTRHFGVMVVTKEGKAWYKKHTEASYFSDVYIDRESLAREFQQILRQIRELWMKYIFAEPAKCNLHMVREFYANWAPEAKSHYVTVRGRNVPITPTYINDILAIVKYVMRKARVHKGHMYDFGGLIIKMCCTAGVLEEHLDYMAPRYPASHHWRDEHIMARMYGLEMLCHQNGCHAPTDMQLGQVTRLYEPIENDILTDEEHAHTSSDVDFNSEEEIDPAQAGDEANGDDAMED
ncbi:hypothetical protein R3W88_033753 [Solanum pinnatisectum]|uniref:Putative plant transposon protein domain-containing protein n=1 Tax=Solanum pinnatisectum TaxID=50273 RepID=A0AAV9K0H0_9SOLN|nr:hypothetical protein R3W88_033753 [Solanum pinnatisectum]